MNISNNRKFFNQEMLPKLRRLLKGGDTILNIGKSLTWESTYKDFFKDFSYKTCDRNHSVEPDIVLDVEEVRSWVNQVDSVIAMGVTEQASNPFNLVNGIWHLLKKDGLALFGIVSTGYPIYSTDLTRFTPNGGLNLLKSFNILESHIIGDEKNPEYLFYIAKKI